MKRVGLCKEDVGYAHTRDNALHRVSPPDKAMQGVALLWGGGNARVVEDAVRDEGSKGVRGMWPMRREGRVSLPWGCHAYQPRDADEGMRGNGC